MSMEQAIQELANGMKELAAAMREIGADTQLRLRKAEMMRDVHQSEAFAAGAEKTRLKEEMERAVSKVEKEAASEKAAKEKQLEEECAAKKKEIEDAQQADIDHQKATAKENATGESAESVDYLKDVKPVLLQLNKAKGREALAGLLKKYGAATGDKLTAESLPDILADAQALLAA